MTATQPKISLVHATYHREPGPLEVKEAWLQLADNPGSVEHIFAMDADDEETVIHTQGHLRVISPPGNGKVTSVRNWNAAALMSRGDLIMVIADDLFPPPAWDTKLIEAIGPLNPRRTRFALKVTDSPVEGDTLLRHPVVSRAYYRHLGLFSDRFHGVFCDDDITRRAFLRSAILDGRGLVLEHRHPTLDRSLESSRSQRLINADAEYELGSVAYLKSWSRRQRTLQIYLVPTGANANLSASVLLAFRWRSWFEQTMRYSLDRLTALVRLSLHPREFMHRLSAWRSSQ